MQSFNNSPEPQRSNPMDKQFFSSELSPSIVREFLELAQRWHQAKEVGEVWDSMSPQFYMPETSYRVISNDEQSRRKELGYAVFGYTTIGGKIYCLAGCVSPKDHPALMGTYQKAA